VGDFDNHPHTMASRDLRDFAEPSERNRKGFHDMRWDYSGIPGTTVFDGRQSRRGYHLNQFCMSLLKPANRDRFKADEEAYLSE
jgi:hypothetical protein